MSKTWAAEDYGLYVLSDDFKEYADKNGIDVYKVGYDYGFNSYSDAEGECYPIIKEKHENFNVNGNHFFIASLEKFPELFTQAYKNEQEALQELKENYGEFLPDDFDYEAKFVHFVGTTFG
jgi:hypothetical protein